MWLFKKKKESKKYNHQPSVEKITAKISFNNEALLKQTEQFDEKLSEEYIMVGFLSWAQYGYEIYNRNDEYPRWTSYKLHLFNPKLKHKELIMKGYLVPAQTEFALRKCKISQLQEILKQNNLETKGKKDDLIERIIANVGQSSLELPTYYVLSPKGESFLKNHEDLVEVYYNKYNITECEYNTAKAEMPSYCKVNDIFWRIFQKRYDEHFKNKDWELLRCVEHDRAMLLQSEHKYKDALDRMILVTYYDLSGCGNGNRVEEEKYVEAVPGILKKIHELGEFYEEHMIDRCYRNYLPHHYMDKEKFRSYIKEIINEYPTE